MEITVESLTEMDKLVQLIESPIFACEFLLDPLIRLFDRLIIQIFFLKTNFVALRLTLVSQNRIEAQHLSQALFGLLMLLPQTDAFFLLKNRLQCVPNFTGIRENASVQPKNYTNEIENNKYFFFSQYRWLNRNSK